MPDAGRSSGGGPAPEPETYTEVTLADIVKILHRRKLVLGVTFLVVLLAGVAVTATTAPEYESKATIIPLEHRDIIKNWLDSRLAAELVVDALGEPLLIELYPDRWDEGSGSWEETRPGRERAAARLMEQVTITTRDSGTRATEERFLQVAVQMGDPVVARDVAESYIGTLERLRPDLENITRQEAFDRYYDGSNEQAAQSRAEVTAKQLDYWLALDAASMPEDPVSPNVKLNIALSVVLGLVLGVFLVFFVEWLSNYRAQNRALEVPDEDLRPEFDRSTQTPRV